ncbi:hypothetical protein [Chryseolinea soli]|uniref:Uncharacterized protein n=1 Tax=Chryseolinea soli TaxID=2321403 RepID=A0A385SR52_9BACT|nr:hypothetical protein [Chryseolinea soli]AYB33046.1 hypothetical protein D4L85_21785 [Chryseolinea soli]
MTNIYWAVYKNLEAEIVKLTYAIHVDDNQLEVYSSLISDLILRASAEIESISKELYKANGGTKTQKIKYDSDALDHLNGLWKIDKKVVLISSINCYQTSKILIPFAKNETSTFHGGMTYSWNNSYQNLKHDRANSLRFGSIKYLFDIMAALFILNIYYKSERYPLKRDAQATSFPIGLGSELFSIKLHAWSSYDGKNNYLRRDEFDECLYFTGYTKDSLEEIEKAHEEMVKHQEELFSKHPKFINYQKNNNIQDYKGNNLMFDVLGRDDYMSLMGIASPKMLEVYKTTEFEGLINKDDA